VQQESLAELIRRRLSELERSARAAAAQSHGLVSHFTLSRHANGETRKLTHRTAQGIALAIDVPLDEVMAAAGLPMTPGPFQLPARADLLTSKERQAIIAVMDALLASRDALPATTGKRKRVA
jgi:hypothetical protein